MWITLASPVTPTQKTKNNNNKNNKKTLMNRGKTEDCEDTIPAIGQRQIFLIKLF